ncbi:MAG: hypothetical protein ACTS3F_04735 [Phycisphaerales bacterium]
MLRTFLGLPERLDGTFGDPRIAAIRDAVAQRDWDLCEWIMSEASPGDERWFVCDRVSEAVGRIAPFVEWVNDRPGSPAARLLYATRLLDDGWKARGEGVADTVTEKMAEVYYRCTEESIAEFMLAAEMDPRDLTALIGLARANIEDLPAARRSFKAAFDRDPDCWASADAVVYASTQKWSGSHQGMYKAMDWITASTRDDSPARASVLLGHIERWLYTYLFEDKEKLADSYYESSKVIDSVRSIVPGLLGSQKVARLAVRPAIYGRCAYICSEIRDFDLALRAFELCEGHITDWPWCYRGDPTKVWRLGYKHAKRAAKR